MIELNPKCLCGRNARYMHRVNGVEVMSCNKYGVCESYDEIAKHRNEMLSDLCYLLRVAETISTHKESSDQYKSALEMLKEIQRKYKV